MVDKNSGERTAQCGRIATVGTFDGLHRGHLAVIDCLRREGRRLGLEPLIVTFSNHPLDVIAPQRAPGRLGAWRSGSARLEMSEELHGVKVLVERFDRELCALTARRWLERLRDVYQVRAVVLGYDNTFGSDGRRMSRADYRELCRSLGVLYVDAPKVEGCSSSAARKALASGDVEEARRILGRPYSLGGTVVHGDALGRTIGVPTANIDPDDPLRIIPAEGVYAVEARADGAVYPAVADIGRRPTVSDPARKQPLRVEVHLIGETDLDLYGKKMEISFLRRLRDEVKFPDLDSLKRQIHKDITESKRIFASLGSGV